MTASTDLQFYLRVAIDINKKVGGTRAYQAQSNIRERFVVIRDSVTKSLQSVRVRLDSPHRLDSVTVSELKGKLSEVFDQLQRMREAVSYENTANVAAQELKYQLVDRLTAQAKELEMGISNSSDNPLLRGNKKEETYTEIKAQLLNSKSTRVKQKDSIYLSQPRADTSQYEKGVINRWEDTDRRIDEGVDKLIDQTKKWKQAVLKTGVLIDETDKKIGELTTDVDKINQDLFTSNKKLKGVVEKLRKPHKFCIDIVLVLILIGLVVAIFKLSSK